MTRLRRSLALVALALLGLVAALEIHFVDVGQGDGVLIVLPDGRAVVVDAGNADGAMLRYLQAHDVDEVVLVVATHAHADHVGGLPAVLDAYPPVLVLDNGIAHTTRTYEHYLDAVARSGALVLDPGARTIALGEVVIAVLPAPNEPSWGHNDNSVGLIVEYGGFRASLTGDAEPRLFAWWLEQAPALFAPVDVHKASHHGSDAGDTDAALARLRPSIVVVSAGADNRFAHPHDTALARYGRVGAAVYRTDHHGSVVVRVDPDGRYVVEPERDVSGIGPARLLDVLAQGLACVR